MPDREKFSFAQIHKELQNEVGQLETDSSRAKLIDVLATLAFEIKRIQQRQRVYAAALRAQGVIMGPELTSLLEQMPKHATIDARDAFDSMNGIYQLEYGEFGAYRWTGPTKETSFRAWIDRGIPITLEANMFSFGDPRNRSDITLTIDGASVPLVCGEKLIRSEPFPIREGVGATEIIFSVPHAFCPKDQGGDDPRELRMAFHKLTLYAVNAG